MAEEVTVAQLVERMATKEELRALTERVAKVEGIIEQMNERLNHIETRLTWMLGVMITLWVTMITMWVTIILTILKR
ncbi:MAG: hypothetical protein ACE5MB_00935 [Anaerolineae bacterium]